MKLCWEAMGGALESCMRGPLTGRAFLALVFISEALEVVNVILLSV